VRKYLVSAALAVGFALLIAGFIPSPQSSYSAVGERPGYGVPLVPTGTPPVPCYGTCIIERAVDVGAEDAGEDALSGNPCVYHTNLNEVYLGNCAGSTPIPVAVVSGFRFDDVTVPYGAIVTDARLIFTTDGDYSHGIDINIYGEWSGDAQAFSDSNPPSARATTTAVVPQRITGSWHLGEQWTSNDVSDVVNEVRTHPNWSTGHSIAFIVAGDGTDNYYRRIIAYERSVISPQFPPARLRITYYYMAGTPTPTPLPGLSRATAVFYADTYAVTPNSAYRYFGTGDDSKDCTNFVSQATKAGGYPEQRVPDPSREWYYTGYYWYSQSWTVVWDFLYVFYNMGWGDFWGRQTDYGDSSSVRYNAAYPADVLVYDWQGDGIYDHVTIQALNGSPATCDPSAPSYCGDLVDGHSSDHYHAIWTLWPYNVKRTTTKVYLLHVWY
jgi:hypothetical protein